MTHPVIDPIESAPAYVSTAETSAACTGCRMDEGIVGPHTKRTTRSGRWPPRPMADANCGWINPPSTG